VYEWVLNNQSQLVLNEVTYPNANNFDLIERIPAGYLMNTIELSSRFVWWLVFALKPRMSTRRALTRLRTLCPITAGRLSQCPASASLRITLDRDSDLRLVYGRGLARPDPQDLSGRSEPAGAEPDAGSPSVSAIQI
jgi:hypothetical protein